MREAFGVQLACSSYDSRVPGSKAPASRGALQTLRDQLSQLWRAKTLFYESLLNHGLSSQGGKARDRGVDLGLVYAQAAYARAALV